MKKVLALLAMVLVLVGAYFLWEYLAQEMRHREELRKMQEVITRLGAERRVAQVVVKERTTDASGMTMTTLEFLEWDREGKRLEAVKATVPGKEVYFDSLVIKFDREYVEQGDALRGKTIILFRRIFGSAQKPEEGVLIDAGAKDGIPDIYRVDKNPSAFEAKLWKRFWDYAEHEDEAKKLGVRVVQGEAVAKRLTANTVYELTCEAAGGINLKQVMPESK